MKDRDYVEKCISPWTAARFNSLPDFTKQQLVLEREVHGSIQLSQIETERLLSHLVSIELKQRKADKRYQGSFSAVCHYFGYQGRCALTSIYDCQLGNCYGYLAGVLIEARCTGYCTTARGVNGPVKNWHLGGIPIISMTSVKAKSSYG